MEHLPGDAVQLIVELKLYLIMSSGSFPLKARGFFILSSESAPLKAAGLPRLFLVGLIVELKLN